MAGGVASLRLSVVLGDEVEVFGLAGLPVLDGQRGDLTAEVAGSIARPQRVTEGFV